MLGKGCGGLRETTESRLSVWRDEANKEHPWISFSVWPQINFYFRFIGTSILLVVYKL